MKLTYSTNLREPEPLLKDNGEMDGRAFFAFSAAALLAAPEASVGVRNYDTCGVFQDSFLMFPEEVCDAARAGKREIAFIEQVGCPYCRRMMQVTFADRRIVETLKTRFYMVALDMYGVLNTVWVDGKARSEKALARHAQVRGTPTMLFLDEMGEVVERVVGYRSPSEFQAILERTERG